MRVTIIQTDIVNFNIEANLRNYQEKFLDIDSDIIILPEFFTTGFCIEPSKYSETMNGVTVNWMKSNSKILNSVICGSLIIEDNGLYYDRFIWVEPNGDVKTYDRRHIPEFNGESDVYECGSSKLIIEYKGWRISPFIGHDLRFPVWSRNTDECDIMIYVANWVSKRKFAWRSLLTSRSIENQCYVVGVNRIGSLCDNLYRGDSCLISPNGETLYITAHVENIYTVELDKREIDKVRSNMPLKVDKYKM